MSDSVLSFRASTIVKYFTDRKQLNSYLAVDPVTHDSELLDMPVAVSKLGGIKDASVVLPQKKVV